MKRVNRLLAFGIVLLAMLPGAARGEDFVAVSIGGHIAGIDLDHATEVTVTVRDENEDDLAITHADSLGRFGPLRLRLEPGIYTVFASWSGEDFHPETIEVPEGRDTLSIELALRAMGAMAAPPPPATAEPPPMPPPPVETSPPPAPKNGHPATANGHSDGDKNYAVVRVFYGTNRAATGNAKPGKFYGSNRGGLSLGTCEVSIPRDHRMGKLEKPSIWKLEFRNNPEKHVVLLSITAGDSSAFFTGLRARVGSSSTHSAFVFVHGYNVTFEDAARRAAQFSYDLGFDGAPILYSWPSRGDETKYTADEEAVDASAPQLAEFLRALEARSGATTIHLISHSMGARVLASALKELALAAVRPDSAVFTQLVLTAPDIDPDVFRDFAQRFRGLASRVTLYASSEDIALKASRKFHSTPRAGESGERLVLLPGVDTIDVTAVDTSLLGHSYFADNTSVLADLHYLLVEGMPPESRHSLRSAVRNGATYWVFQP